MNGQKYEYKHFKETSTNHSWTFNDYTDNLINNMHTYSFIFAHINDYNYKYPGIMDWYYQADGSIIKKYLKKATRKIKNTRKMINVSPNQLERIGLKKIFCDKHTAKLYSGKFQNELKSIAKISHNLEKLTGIDKILTSNKLYELLVALELNHFVNSEQGGREGAHDAFDCNGKTFEYKVYKKHTWNFQDISDNVLDKYYKDDKIFLAVVDKTNLTVKGIYSVTPKDIVPMLKYKLNLKIEKAKSKNKEIRRKQVNITFKEIKLMPSFSIIKN
jgi:hypothetical protein